MENPEGKYTIEDFRKEISEVSKNPENEGDFPEEINPDNLTEEDMDFWTKIKDKGVEQADLDRYIEKFKKDNAFHNKSRDYFRMFAVQRAQVIIGKREIEQHE